MRREYTYENATVCIVVPDDIQMQKFKKATEVFLRKVLEERSKHGNGDKSGAVNKEQVLGR